MTFLKFNIGKPRILFSLSKTWKQVNTFPILNGPDLKILKKAIRDDDDKVIEELVDNFDSLNFRLNFLKVGRKKVGALSPLAYALLSNSKKSIEVLIRGGASIDEMTWARVWLPLNPNDYAGTRLEPCRQLNLLPICWLAIHRQEEKIRKNFKPYQMTIEEVSCFQKILPHCSRDSLLVLDNTGNNLIHYLAMSDEKAKHKALDCILFLSQQGLDTEQVNRFGENPASLATDPDIKSFLEGLSLSKKLPQSQNSKRKIRI